MKVDREIYNRLKTISELSPWNVEKKLKEFIKGLQPRSERTNQQSRALHLWFKLVAEELNNGGFNVQHVLKDKIDIDWNERLVKEVLWKESQERILGKKSTTELDKIEDINIVYEHLNRHLGEKYGVHVPFPSIERTLSELTGKY